MNPWFNDTNLKDEDFANLYDSINFIKRHEGFSPSVYPDAGNKKANIGYGFQNTGLNEIDRTTADRMLNNYLKNQRSSYRNSVYTDKMTPWGRIVADDLLYRGGYGSLKNTKILKALQMGNDEEVAKYLPEYKYATDPETKQKKVITGLMNRNDALMKVKDSLGKINVSRVDENGHLREQVKSNPLDIFDVLNKIESQPTYFNPIRGEETPAFVNKLPVVDETYVNPNSWNASDVLNIAKGMQPSIKMTPSPLSTIQPEDVPKIEQEIQEEKTQQDDNISKSLTPILGQNEEVEDPKTLETTEPKKELTEEEKLQKMMDDYKARRMLASETEGKNALISSMLNAGSTIGAAIAGVKPDREGIKALNLNKDLTKDVDSENNELYKLQSLVRDLALAKERAAAKRDLDKEKLESDNEKRAYKSISAMSNSMNSSDKARSLSAVTEGLRQTIARGNELFATLPFKTDEFGAKLYDSESLVHALNKLTPAQKEESLRSLETVLGGKAPTQGGLKTLRDSLESYQGGVRGFLQKVINQPITTNEGKILSTIYSTLQRENELLDETMRDYRYQSIPLGMEAKKYSPELYDQTLLNYDITPIDIELRNMGMRASDIVKAQRIGLSKEEILEKLRSGKRPTKESAIQSQIYREKMGNTNTSEETVSGPWSKYSKG